MNFDRFKDNYREQVKNSLRGSGADSDFILEYKGNAFIEILKKYLNEKKLSELNVLDFGCGIGLMDHYWSNSFFKLTGIDLSSGSLEIAAKSNPQVRYLHYDGKNFPFERKEKFDAVVAVCVLHHIAPQEWIETFKKIKTLLNPKGLFVVFEHNPLNPATQWVVSHCELDNDANLLTQFKTNKLGVNSGFKHLETKNILYLPWRGKVFRAIETIFNFVPLGGQYYSVFQNLEQ